jgi:hypothetical protein
LIKEPPPFTAFSSVGEPSELLSVMNWTSDSESTFSFIVLTKRVFFEIGGSRLSFERNFKNVL